MIQRSYRTTATGAAALLLVLSMPVLAWQFSPPDRQPYALPNPSLVSMNSTMLFARSRSTNASTLQDPTHSNILFLLLRPDVRNELLLDAKQRQAIDALQKTTLLELNQRARQQMLDSQAIGSLPQAERQAKMRHQMNASLASIQQYAESLNKRAEAILNASQVKRLSALDLQWRGPMAMADTAVAAQVGLSRLQHDKVMEILAEYNRAQQEVYRTAYANRKGGSATLGASSGEPSQKEMQAILNVVQRETIQAHRRIADTVLPMLSETQKETWRQMQGQPFTFHTSD